MKILTHPTTNGQHLSTQKLWEPGAPLPKDSHPDATRALQRNADAFEAHEREQRGQILLFKRKAGAPPAIIRGGGLEAA
jgi:hypothetical protein